jgi:hypothetical protein
MKIKAMRACVVGIGLAVIVLVTGMGFAGIEWTSTFVRSGKGDPATDIHHVYAQSGLVREEFVQVEGKSGLGQKGTWWLYQGNNNTITIVDPDKKTYVEMSMDSLLQLVGALGQFVQMKITNATSTMQELAPESVGAYECRHVVITNAYDMEMKVLIMKVSSHIEQKKEIWATTGIPMEEVSFAYSMRSIKSGILSLDSLIDQEIETYKNMGFTVKSLTVETSTTKGKSETTTTEMTVSDVAVKDISADLFTVPADYKKVDFSMIPGGGK